MQYIVAEARHVFGCAHHGLKTWRCLHTYRATTTSCTAIPTSRRPPALTGCGIGTWTCYGWCVGEKGFMSAVEVEEMTNSLFKLLVELQLGNLLVHAG